MISTLRRDGIMHFKRMLEQCSLLKDGFRHVFEFIIDSVTPIPKKVCDCGKLVVFPRGKQRFVCSRCGIAWQLRVIVSPIKRTDWDCMAKEVISLIRRLQKKPREMRLGYQRSPGGIINAYREGDITFKKAVLELERWKKT